MTLADIGVRLHVGQGTHRGALTVFPVWTDGPSAAPDYLTGAAAPVDVEERAGSPAVDQLVVTNRADRPVLLLAGELLEGGWQHRALTATTLLPPNRPTVLPVVCVEQGRWHGDAVHRRQARRVPLAVLPRLDSQAEVWRRVSRYEAVAGPSATDSLAERLDRAAPRARDLTRGLRPLAGQRGLLVGAAGRPAWLELFDSARTLKAHWSGLLQAATLDALGRPELRTPAALARGFAERVEKTRLTLDGPAGLGRRFRGGGQVRLDAVAWHDRTVHLTAVDLTHPLQEA
ncbi:ARPP-1 family domain-containing protein [Geodermatophilus sp. SYSU D01105]